jgi:FkbM family methyltransferase
MSPMFRGKQRLVRSLDALLRTKDRPLLRTVRGVCFRLDTADLIDFELAYHGGHDRHVLDHIATMVGSSPEVLWDVGANVGAISLPLARRFANLVVHAFEPSPKVVTRLRENVALNPGLAGRLFIHPFAVADRCTMMPFYESDERSNSGVGSLLRGANTSQHAVQVPAYTCDAIVDQLGIPKPTIMKLDVEGSEFEVLSGASFLASCPNIRVVFESSAYRLKEAGRGPSRVVELFQGWGYEISGIEFLGGRACPLAEVNWHQNVDLVARRP